MFLRVLCFLLLLQDSSADVCNHSCLRHGTCRSKRYSDSCFYLFNDKHRTWNEAKYLCSHHQLAMGVVSEDLLKNQFTMKGLVEREFQTAWLGTRARTLESWQFVNGSSVCNSDMARNFKIEKDCKRETAGRKCGVVTMTNRMEMNFTFDQSDCESTPHRFICQWGEDFQMMSIPELNWFSARSACLVRGGDLLHSTPLIGIIEVKMPLYLPGQFFIGATTFTWENADESNGITGETDGCIVISGSNVRSERACNTRNFAMCQQVLPRSSENPTTVRLMQVLPWVLCGSTLLANAFLVAYIVWKHKKTSKPPVANEMITKHHDNDNDEVSRSTGASYLEMAGETNSMTQSSFEVPKNDN